MNKIANSPCFCWALIGLFHWNISASFPHTTLLNRSGVSALHSRVAKAKPGKEYLRLISKLRGQRVTVRSSKERVRQPFFSVSGRIIMVNNEGLQVFEYPTQVAAANEAERVSQDGMTIGSSKPSWMAPPHFFKRGTLIVIYVGNNQTILNILKATLGGQFAGG